MADGSVKQINRVGYRLESYNMAREDEYSESLGYVTAPGMEGTYMDFPASGFVFSPGKNEIFNLIAMRYFDGKITGVHRVRMGMGVGATALDAYETLVNGLTTDGFGTVIEQVREQYHRYRNKIAD